MQNTLNNKRDYLFDNLKALLIFLVVFGHCIEKYIHDSNMLRSLYLFIYIFHMPLFIFVSGYFSKNIEKCKKNSIDNILIPYILFNIVWYGVNSILDRKLTFSFIAPGWALWYLLSLFYWRISLQYLVKIKNIIVISVILAIVLGIVGISSLSISRTFAFLPFFLLGYYCDNKIIYRIKNIDKKYCYLSLISIFIISMYIVYNFDVNVMFLYNSQSYSDFNLNILLGMSFKFSSYIGAIILSISVINLIPANKKFYSYIGKYTLTVYLLHIYPVKILYKLIPNWNESILSNLIILSSALIITLILSTDLVQKLYNNTFGRVKLKNKKLLMKEARV